jgi:hypothetical protein
MKEIGLGGDPIAWGVPTKWLSIETPQTVTERPHAWKTKWIPLYACSVKSTSITDHTECICRPYCDNID